MNFTTKGISILLTALVLNVCSFAAPRFWVGKGINDNWNNPANWSATSGGAGGASVPDPTDNCFFDGAGAGAYNFSCTLDTNVTVNTLRAMPGFAQGIINQGVFSVTINGGDFKWEDGSFSGGAGFFKIGPSQTNITIINGIVNIGPGGFSATGNGPFDLNGGTFSLSAGTFYTDKLYTQAGGIFNGGSAEVKFRDKNFNLDGGTFNSTSANLFFSSNAVNIRNVPGWNHNNCTVYFDSTNTTSLSFGIGPNTSCDFYKVIVDKNSLSSANDNLKFLDADTMNVLTDMHIITGEILYSQAAVKINGNLTAETGFINSNVAFLFTGSINQTIELKGTAYDKMDGLFFVRKPTTNYLTFLSPVK